MHVPSSLSQFRGTKTASTLIGRKHEDEIEGFHSILFPLTTGKLTSPEIHYKGNGGGGGQYTASQHT